MYGEYTTLGYTERHTHPGYTERHTHPEGPKREVLACFAFQEGPKREVLSLLCLPGRVLKGGFKPVMPPRRVPGGVYTTIYASQEGTRRGIYPLYASQVP